MSFNAIRENKIPAKISGFTVYSFLDGQLLICDVSFDKLLQRIKYPKTDSSGKRNYLHLLYNYSGFFINKVYAFKMVKTP